MEQGMSVRGALRTAGDFAASTHPHGAPAQAAADPIDDMWYLAVPGRRLKRGRTVGMELLGRPIVLGRDRTGAVFALRDQCPHRGIPLSHGKFDGAEIECCYHGWRFDCTGSWTH